MGLCLSLFKRHHVRDSDVDLEHITPTYISSRIFATMDPMTIMEYRISVTQNSGSMRNGKNSTSVRNRVNSADVSQRMETLNISRVSITERRPRIIDYATSAYLPMK